MQIEGGRGAILFRGECPSHFVYLGGWLGKYVVFRQFLVVYLGGMNMFSVRKTVGAYRIRPDVREVFAALLGDAVVWFAWFAHVRAYAIRPYTCSIEFFA